jgi:hypothetical protein
MAAVLTTSSTITCSHQGTVQKTSTAKLKVNGSPVLLESSLGAIPDCPNQSSSTTKDTKVASVLGAAQKLKAGGNGVLLATLSGKGNGSPPGDLSATAGQALLKGV